MKILLRVLFFSAAFAAAFVLARQQKLLRPIVRYFRPPVPLGEYRDPFLDHVAEYRTKVTELLGKKDYGALTAEAKQARESKARFANGGWKLVRFYDAFAPSDEDPDVIWLGRLQQLNGWLAAQPSEGAPYIATADFYVDYAWRARGSGYANTVSPAAAQLFLQRLTTANQILDRGAAIAKNDPHFWAVRHIVARGLDGPRAHQDAILAAGLKVEPQYIRLYITHATALLPRWRGRPGEMEQFAVAATKVPGGLGDEAYAWISGAMDDMHGDVFKATKLEWPRVDAGYKAWLARCPDEPSILSAYAMLACRAGDTPTARRLFEELDDRVDLRTWKNVETYRRHYNHVNPEEKK